MNAHLDPEFSSYVKDRYKPTSPISDQMLKSVFSIEWFDIKRDDLRSLIELHPDLTKGDQRDLEEITDSQTKDTMIMATKTGILFSALAYYRFSQLSKVRRFSVCAMAWGLTSRAYFDYFS